MDNKVNGYWVIATQKHLKEFTSDSSNLDEFDNIDISGKMGRFIGAIRGNTYIDNIPKIEKIANTVGIKPKELYRIILPTIEQVANSQIKIKKDVSGEVIGIEEYVFTNDEVITLAGNAFEKLGPKNVERITVETLDNTKRVPFLESELYGMFSRIGFKEQDISFALSLQQQFKLIQRLDKMNANDPIFSNEYIWGKNHDKIAYAISQVSFDDKQNLKQIIDQIQFCQGTPTEELKNQNSQVIMLAKKVGMINPINIISSRGIEKEFAFSSDILKPLTADDDLMDDVKILLASIRFGERYTKHSTITQPLQFLHMLIEADSVGPHSANLTDYILLEKKGIVKVVEDTKTRIGAYGPYTRTGPCLKLIKKDVAQKAIELIQNSNYSIGSQSEAMVSDTIDDKGYYRNPEEIRVRLGNTPEYIKEAEERLNMILRDETI